MSTSTVPHHELVEALVGTLSFRQIGVVHQEYVVSADCPYRKFGPTEQV